MKGDAFAPRNPQALKIDFVERPPILPGAAPPHKAQDRWRPGPQGPQGSGAAGAHQTRSENRGLRLRAKPETDVLLDVKDLCVDFGSRRKPFHAVKHVSFQIHKGETFGLVGESGSGKTTIGRAIIRIHPTAGGEVWFQGEKISGKVSHEVDRAVTRKIQMIFQDPMASLNERAKVDYIVSEGLYAQKLHLTQAQREEKVAQGPERRGPPARVRQPLPPMSSPAASASASASPGPSSWTPTSSSPTNPSRPWTCPSGPRSST